MQPTDIIIDPEFKIFCRALTAEERAQLRANILEDGQIRDALTVWPTEAGPVMVDGHNRLELWLAEGRQAGIPEPTIEQREFASRLDVLRWMDAQQSGRRNETEADIAYRRGKLYEAEKKASGGQPENENAASEKRSGHNDHFVSDKTSETVGRSSGVSERTVRRDAEYAGALDRIAHVVGEAVRADIRSGNLVVPKKRVIDIAALSPVRMREAIDELRSGKSPPTQNGTPPKKSTLVDGLKQPVPDGLVPVFEHRATFGRLCREMNAILKQAVELHETAAGVPPQPVGHPVRRQQPAWSFAVRGALHHLPVLQGHGTRRQWKMSIVQGDEVVHRGHVPAGPE